MGKCIVYAYDVSGLRTSLKDPDLQENVYVYDNDGRLVTEQLEAGKTVYFAYDASGMLTRRHMPQNVIIAYYDYDAAGRNTVNKQKGAFLDERIYYRNANGAIVAEADPAFPFALYYSYDALDRLTQEKILSSGTITSNAYYAWDAASNRTIKTDEVAPQRTYYTYDSRNLLSKEQILAGTTTYYDFDSAQRMTRQRAGAIVTYFGFTQRDQIARLHNVGLADPIQYFNYSGAGERVRVREGSTETYWSHDGGKLLRERQSTGTLVARYRHNMSPVTAGSNVMTYFRRSDTSEWVNVSPKYNHQGSVQVLSETDGSESAVATYVYEDQFGVTDLTSATSASAQRLQFAIGVPMIAVKSMSQGALFVASGLWLPGSAIGTTGASDGLSLISANLGLFDWLFGDDGVPPGPVAPPGPRGGFGVGGMLGDALGWHHAPRHRGSPPAKPEPLDPAPPVTKKRPRPPIVWPPEPVVRKRRPIPTPEPPAIPDLPHSPDPPPPIRVAEPDPPPPRKSGPIGEGVGPERGIAGQGPGQPVFQGPTPPRCGPNPISTGALTFSAFASGQFPFTLSDAFNLAVDGLTTAQPGFKLKQDGTPCGPAVFCSTWLVWVGDIRLKPGPANPFTWWTRSPIGGAIHNVVTTVAQNFEIHCRYR